VITTTMIMNITDVTIIDGRRCFSSSMFLIVDVILIDVSCVNFRSLTSVVVLIKALFATPETIASVRFLSAIQKTQMEVRCA
jgi:hypothetical protein